MKIRVTMAIGFECRGERNEIMSYGLGDSRKAAKTDAYRKGMSTLRRRCAPHRYKVVFSIPTSYAEIEEVQR